MSCVSPDSWLSATRFAPFLNAAGGDYERALDLYDWHAELSAASFEVIHRFEVVVRNAIDGILGEGQPQEPVRETWLLDFDLLSPGGVKQVIFAIERLEKGKSLTRGRVIAGLPFGFWAGLFGNRYEELWRGHLRYAFPHGSPLRKDLAASMGRIRRFRNRVAHHDCLLAQDVSGLTEEMLRVVGWIDPDAEAWVSTRARVFDLLERRPGAGVPQACSAAGASAAMPSR
jgi:hypothetical protein